jgi:hypothetical protein
MTRTTLVIALCLFTASACKKKKEEGTDTTKTTSGDMATGAKTTDKAAGGDMAAGDKAASDKPKEMSATDLWNDYNKPGQDGMALMEKWRGGVIVNGTIKTVAGENSVWLDGAGHNVQLDFTDAAALKAKGVKAGDTVTAQCKIGGSDGSNLMMLTDCVLK